MGNKELVDYIKGQFDEGVSKEEIKNILVKNGWEGEDVEEAFSMLYTPPTAPVSSTPTPTAPEPITDTASRLTPIVNASKQSSSGESEDVKKKRYFKVIIITAVILFIFVISGAWYWSSLQKTEGLDSQPQVLGEIPIEILLDIEQLLPEFKKPIITNIHFANNGSFVARVADSDLEKIVKPSQYIIFQNGKITKLPQDRNFKFNEKPFSEDGKTLVYGVKENSKWKIVINKNGVSEAINKTFDDLFEGPLVSPSGDIITFPFYDIDNDKIGVYVNYLGNGFEYMNGFPVFQLQVRENTVVFLDELSKSIVLFRDGKFDRIFDVPKPATDKDISTNANPIIGLSQDGTTVVVKILSHATDNENEDKFAYLVWQDDKLERFDYVGNVSYQVSPIIISSDNKLIASEVVEDGLFKVAVLDMATSSREIYMLNLQVQVKDAEDTLVSLCPFPWNKAFLKQSLYLQCPVFPIDGFPFLYKNGEVFSRELAEPFMNFINSNMLLDGTTAFIADKNDDSKKHVLVRNLISSKANRFLDLGEFDIQSTRFFPKIYITNDYDVLFGLDDRIIIKISGIDIDLLH